jgi:hypothetical protein
LVVSNSIRPYDILLALIEICVEGIDGIVAAERDSCGSRRTLRKPDGRRANAVPSNNPHRNRTRRHPGLPDQSGRAAGIF